MIISSSNGYLVENSVKEKLLCRNCHNNAIHELYAYPKGLQLGFFWIPDKYKIGLREYYLKCTICSNLIGPVNKESYL